jgi:hypothetical protein
MQNSAFILNIFSFLHNKKIIRNSSLIINFLKSAIFIVLELSLETASNKNNKYITNDINYFVYTVEGLVI